jgi:hypothetical protein
MEKIIWSLVNRACLGQLMQPRNQTKACFPCLKEFKKIMRKHIWLAFGLALIAAIVVGSPVRTLACGPAIAAGAAMVPAIGGGIVGTISTIGEALGVVQTAKDVFAPGYAPPPSPGPSPEYYGYNPVPGYVAPGYPTSYQGSSGYGYLEPSGPTPY